jgi:copper chaperone
MELRPEVENVKCRGCARVDPSQGSVLIEAGDDVRAEAAATLAKIGYPEKGSLEGVKAAAAAAKSFVSCAIGRLSD